MRKFIEQTQKIKNSPWRPVLSYIIFGVLWIYFSDLLLAYLVANPDVYERVQTYKGIFYVLFTGVFLYFFIYYDAKKIFRLAYYDELTQLKNRTSFMREIPARLRRTRHMNVYMIDVNNFKYLNEIHGHEYGDLLLKNVASSLQDIAGCEVYRFWSDKFLILENATHDMVADTLRRIRVATQREWPIYEIEFEVTVNIGVVRYPEDTQDAKELIQMLDMAMFKAKTTGRGRYQIYEPSLMEEVQYYSMMERELNVAISQDRLRLYCQPILDMNANEIESYEILLRWDHENSIFDNIGRVIEAAEYTQQIGKIDQWVVRNVFQQIARNPILRRTNFTINVSTMSIVSDEFYEYVIDMLQTHHIQAERITLEITEHSMVEHFQKTKEMLMKYKALGFMIALDDFGTKYSSMTYLAQLPFDVLKIDKSYVENILKNHEDLAIVKTLIVLGHELGLKVISEGIEEYEQKKNLMQLTCHYGQGYYFARPKPLTSILEQDQG